MIGSVKKSGVYVKSYRFYNLAQYTTHGYYLSIPGIRSKVGIPNNAIIIAVTYSGWGNLGQNCVLGLDGSDSLYLIYTSGYTISSESNVQVQFAYVMP